MPGYDNTTPGSLSNISTIEVPGLLAGVAQQAGPDYSELLGKIKADQEVAAKIGAAGTMKEQIAVERARRQAELAALKAKEAEADLFLKNAPAHAQALGAAYGQTIRDANAIAKGQAKLEEDAAAVGLNPAKYASADGKINHQLLAADKAQLENRKLLVSYGYTLEEATAQTRTSQEADQISSDNPATEPVESTDGGSLSDVPSPAEVAGVAPLAPPPSLTDVAPPVAATLPSQSGITLPAGVAVNANVPLKQAMEAERRKIAQANKIAPRAVTDKQLADSLGIETKEETFVDPKTQNAYNVRVTRGRDGTVYKTSDPTLHELSKTQQAEDKDMASFYTDFVTNGGAERMENSLKTLDEATGILKDEQVSGAVIGLLSDGLKNFVLSDKALKVPTMVKGVVQNNLKLILGSQFTEREGENLMKRVFDPGQAEESNVESVQRFRKDLKDALESRKAAVSYYKDHKTLAGFEAKSLKGNSGGSTTSTSSPSAKLGEVRFRGDRAYTLKEIDGKRVWVAQ